MRKIRILLFLGDVILLYASLVLMIYLRFNESFGKGIILMHLYPFSVVFAVWLVVFYIWDLYNLSFDQYRTNFIKAMFMNVFVAMIMFYIASTSKMAPKTNLLIVSVIYIVLFGIWRSVFFKLLYLNRPVYKVGVIGLTSYTGQLMDLFRKSRLRRYIIEYIVLTSEDDMDEWNSIKTSVPETAVIYSQLDNIEDSVGKLKDVSAVIVSDTAYKNKLEDLYKYIFHGVGVYHIASFIERYYGKIPVYAAGELWFLYNLQEESKKEFERVKRIEDIVASLLGLPLFFLLFPFIAIGIKINSPGPVIFSQTRVGKNNSEFRIHKFRTMVKDAEKDGAKWASEGDSRITGFGSFLRATRLDELPQIFDILRGDMSVVGPRPERPEFVEKLEKKIPFYAIRHFTKPGLTGWAQINAPYASSEEESADKLEYDLYYIKNRSMILDIKIILKTIVTVLQRKGR